MKWFAGLTVVSMVVTSLLAQSSDCVGDHHEGCPVLVATEERRDDPGCKGHQQGSHGSVMWLFKALLGTGTGDSFRPITNATLVRECLDESGVVVRRCPMQVDFAEDGSFSLELWRKAVDEAICRDDVMTIRKYEEQVQLRFQARGCTDLVIRTLWPSPSGPLIMTCSAKK